MSFEMSPKYAGTLICGLADRMADVASMGDSGAIASLAWVLGVATDDGEPPREWWRRFEIISARPVVEHETLMSFLSTERPRGLSTRRGVKRTLELLFAILNVAADQALAGRIRDYLKAHGITPDAITTAEVRPARPGAGRPKKEPTDTDKFVAATNLSAGDPSPTKTGVSNQRLASRLKRDRPDLAARVQAGGLSIRDAAREAGMKLPVVLTIGSPATLAKRILAEKGADYARKLADALLAAIG